MNKRWVLGLASVLIVGAVAAYLTLRPAPDAYSGVRPLVNDLEQAGVDCSELTVSPPEQAEDFGAEFGFCFINNDTVNIHVYEDAARVDEHVEGNISVRGDDPNYFTSLVRGSNWVVDTYSEETSREIRDAIGGRIQ